MRKRSDSSVVVQRAVVAGDIGKDGFPARVDMQDGMVFVQCPPPCGLRQSWDTLTANGPDKEVLRCMRCDANVDPDGVIEAWHAQRGSSKAPKTVASTAPPEVAPEKVHDTAPKAQGEVAQGPRVIVPPADKHAGLQKCPECGVALTKTNTGTFWPCGHDASPLELGVAAAFGKQGANTGRVIPGDELRGTRSAEAAAPSKVTGVDLADGPDEFHVVVVCSELVFTPRQYCTFRVGPFTASAQVRKGDDAEAVVRGLTHRLNKIRGEEFEKCLVQYKAMLDEMTALYGGGR
jgi:hypothetical protein